MASFVRQLNMYGFNRPKESNQHVYIHVHFQKGNMNSMRFIKRKTCHGRDSEEESEISESSSK